MVSLHSISISGQLVLDMHSLNNEAAEGNQQITRMVHIVDGEGNLAVVNAVSGDMLKHIQAAHFQTLAGARSLPLCAGCILGDANRVNLDSAFIETLPKGDNASGLEKVIQHCAMDDAEGVLITAGGSSLPRKSTVEFGWLVGLPEKTRTESYFHVKYDLRSRGKGSGDETGANIGQNIFYRPASSGIYAAVCMIEASRIGFNDISRKPAVDDAARKARAKTVIESVIHTFVRPTGAHRNTQNPHILDFRGVVASSTGPGPAPTVSALRVGFEAEMRAVADQLNRSWPGSVTVWEFGTLSEFAKILTDLAEAL
jgi:CRISPR-associated protein Cst2